MMLRFSKTGSGSTNKNPRSESSYNKKKEDLTGVVQRCCSARTSDEKVQKAELLEQAFPYGLILMFKLTQNVMTFFQTMEKLKSYKPSSLIREEALKLTQAF